MIVMQMSIHVAKRMVGNVTVT